MNYRRLTFTFVGIAGLLLVAMAFAVAAPAASQQSPLDTDGATDVTDANDDTAMLPSDGAASMPNSYVDDNGTIVTSLMEEDSTTCPLWDAAEDSTTTPIKRNGKVGIGTANDAIGRLEVSDGASGQPLIIVSNRSGGSADPRLQFFMENGTMDTLYTVGIDESDYQKLKIGRHELDANTMLTLTGAGLVGIRTPSPSALFEMTNQKHYDGYDASTYDFGSMDATLAITNVLGSSYMPNILFNYDSTTEFSMGVQDVSGSHIFKIGRSAPQTNTALSITESGNIGIATTAPAEKLHVAGNVEVTGNAPQLKIGNATEDAGGLILFDQDTPSQHADIQYDSGSERLSLLNADQYGLTIDNLGRVGIGLAAPSYTVHVCKAATGAVAELRVEGAGDNTNAASISLADHDSGDQWYLTMRDTSAASSDHLLLGYGQGANRTSYLYIHPDISVVEVMNSNVGIGTSTPREKLEVAGKVRVSSGFNVNGADGKTMTYSLVSDLKYVSGTLKMQKSQVTVSGGIITDITAGSWETVPSE